jgi:flagella basal body P-ring formation protein FlgA
MRRCAPLAGALTALLLAALAPIAAHAAPEDGVSGAEARRLVAEAMARAGVSGTVQIAAARPLPACTHWPAVAPSRPGDWRSVDLRCHAPTWERRLRTGAPLPALTRSVSAAPDSAAPAGGAPVLVLTRSLARGTLIEAHHVTPSDGSVRPAQGRLVDPAVVIGRRLTVNLGAGRPILARHLEQRWLVEEGASVAITSEAAGISVTVAGVALGNGQRGDRIRVRNSRSGRVLEATVTDAENVAVAPNMN